MSGGPARGPTPWNSGYPSRRPRRSCRTCDRLPQKHLKTSLSTAGATSPTAGVASSFFFRERSNGPEIAGILLVVAGIVILVLG